MNQTAKLVGHQIQLEMFRNAIRNDRLAHAFLLTGPEGIGKARFAMHLAQGFLCERNDPDAIDPCGHCPGCVQCVSDSHPNLFRLQLPEEKNVIPIDLVLELCSGLSIKGSRGRRKIAIVEEAELLHSESANAFLKTLEEPPSGTILFLIATQPESMIQTILSRCQKISFQPLSIPDVNQVLTQLHPELDHTTKDRLCAWSYGSVGKALELNDHALQEIRTLLLEEISKPKVEVMTLVEKVNDYISDSGKEAAVKRKTACQLISLVLDFFNQALRYAQTGQTNWTSEQATLNRLLETSNSEQLIDCIERCMAADYHIKRYLNQWLSVECWLDDLAQIRSGQYVPLVALPE